MIPRRVKLALLAVIGDDGTGPMWRRLSPDGLRVLAMASREARDLGHPCTADEHVLLGILRDGTSPTAALLREQGTGVRWHIVMAGNVLLSLPALAVFAFAQKHLIRAVARG